MGPSQLFLEPMISMILLVFMLSKALKIFLALYTIFNEGFKGSKLNLAVGEDQA